MRVCITTAGHTVDIEYDEGDMTVHRLANIAVNTWRRTQLPGGLTRAWGASTCGTEQQHGGFGYGGNLGGGDQLDVR